MSSKEIIPVILTVSVIVAVIAIIFASGYYEKDTLATQLRSNAQHMVEQAIADYNINGVSAFSSFDSDSKYHDGELYVFVGRISDGTLVAHGANADLIGVNTNTLIDAEGVNLGDLFLENVTPEGVWLNYLWENPTSNEIEQKTTWMKSFEGYFFGVGVYQ